MPSPARPPVFPLPLPPCYPSSTAPAPCTPPATPTQAAGPEETTHAARAADRHRNNTASDKSLEITGFAFNAILKHPFLHRSIRDCYPPSHQNTSIFLTIPKRLFLALSHHGNEYSISSSRHIICLWLIAAHPKIASSTSPKTTGINNQYRKDTVQNR